MLSFFLCGCSNKSEDRSVIQFASWGSKSEVEILKPVLADFERENPDIKVEFMHIPQNYFQKIHLLFASNKAPDVIFLNNQYLPVYANAGLLKKFSDDEFEKAAFYPKAIKALSWNNDCYAIPRDISMLVIFYNRDIFRKKGVPFPQKTWTMEEFLTVAQMLTSRPDVFGISFEEDVLFYLPYLMSFGGGLLSDDLSTDISETKETIDGLNFYSDLRKKYHVAPLSSESASATMAQMFMQGRLGMYISGRWIVPKFREEIKFDWDIVQFPQGPAGSIVPLDASGWAISSSSRNPDAAFKLVKYLSSKDTIEKFTRSGLIVPARVDVAESKSFLDGAKPYSSRVFLDVIKTSKPTPVSVEYRVILDKTKEKNENLFN